jgi:hypothetical protein
LCSSTHYVHRAELGADEILKEGTQAKDILARPPFLSLVALVAILDPPRDEAIAAVKIAHKAGIEVKMITGMLYAIMYVQSLKNNILVTPNNLILNYGLWRWTL